MNRMVKNSLFLGLAVLVCIEVVVLWVTVSGVSELREEKLDRAKTSYRKTHSRLEEIRSSRKKAGSSSVYGKGALGIAEIKQIAKQAGVSQNPHVKKWPVRAQNRDLNEQVSEIRLFRVSADAVFTFLSALENTGGSSRIKTLNIIKTRGKINVFDLNVWYSTFVPKTGGSK
jgi:hypothetical protein